MTTWTINLSILNRKLSRTTLSLCSFLFFSFCLVSFFVVSFCLAVGRINSECCLFPLGKTLQLPCDCTPWFKNEATFCAFYLLFCWIENPYSRVLTSYSTIIFFPSPSLDSCLSTMLRLIRALLDGMFDHLLIPVTGTSQSSASLIYLWEMHFIYFSHFSAIIIPRFVYCSTQIIKIIHITWAYWKSFLPLCAWFYNSSYMRGYMHDASTRSKRPSSSF